MRLIAGIDTAMPDINDGWSYHATRIQHDLLWQEDFHQISSLGFDLLRWGTPWSLAEPERGQYRWDLIDPKVELAVKLGLEIFYPIAHFNLPTWLPRKGESHAIFAEELPERLAEFTHRLLERYHFRLVIPIVEVQMEAFQRGMSGNWQPHVRNRRTYEQMRQNLVKAFHASAKVAHEHGATVVCSEPAPEIETVLDLKSSVDIAGIDLYPNMHKQKSIAGWLREWHNATGLPVCLSEFGTPESFRPAIKRHRHGFVEPGTDRYRVQQAKLLRAALEECREENIPIPIGGWYPATGNMGWGDALTTDRSAFDCDRAGLVDLARQSDGSLKRVLCAALVKEVLGLRELYTPQASLSEHIPVATTFAPEPVVSTELLDLPSVPEAIPTV